MVERPRVYPDLSRAAQSEFDDDPHLHNLIVARERERKKSCMAARVLIWVRISSYERWSISAARVVNHGVCRWDETLLDLGCAWEIMWAVNQRVSDII